MLYLSYPILVVLVSGCFYLGGGVVGWSSCKLVVVVGVILFATFVVISKSCCWDGTCSRVIAVMSSMVDLMLD